MTIKAIETKYAGCRFRSRLEARWAVFFNMMGIPWEYEPQGFVVGGRPYLPDFFLPECGTWVEVKGHETALDMGLLEVAARELPRRANPLGLQPTLVLLGPIPEIPPSPAAELGWTGMTRSAVFRYGFADYHLDGLPRWLTSKAPPDTSASSVLSPMVYARSDGGGPDAHYERCLRAYETARSARFEHGERPATAA